MSRGVLYLVWKGDCDPSNVLKRSIASLQHWHPELEHRVVYMPEGSNLLVKSQMCDLSPFDETLFLDADTTVMGRLDYGFIKAKQHGMALCINANPWNRRYFKFKDQHPDEIEYSTGVIFFDRDNPKVARVFMPWNDNNATVDSACLFETKDGIRLQPINDQAPFSVAIQQTGFCPFVLPQNWNIYPKWQKVFWGPILIWHGYDDIPEQVTRWNQEQQSHVIRCGQLPLASLPGPMSSIDSAIRVAEQATGVKAVARDYRQPAPPYAFTGPYAGCNEMPEVAMDKRHIFIMHEILKAWEFKSALEIGSFNGASSTAFIEAINSGEGLGKSGIATFCDVSVTDSLIDVARNCRDLSRVRVTPQPSWAVLDSIEEFDFVFVDGAHDMDSVSLELSRIMRRKPLCIMAHDIHATAAGYAKCEGAEMLENVLDGHPEYFCLEDTKSRDGERTERGLLFATTNVEMFDIAEAIFKKWTQ